MHVMSKLYGPTGNQEEEKDDDDNDAYPLSCTTHKQQAAGSLTGVPADRAHRCTSPAIALYLAPKPSCILRHGGIETQCEQQIHGVCPCSLQSQPFAAPMFPNKFPLV